MVSASITRPLLIIVPNMCSCILDLEENGERERNDGTKAHTMSSTFGCTVARPATLLLWSSHMSMHSILSFQSDGATEGGKLEIAPASNRPRRERKVRLTASSSMEIVMCCWFRNDPTSEPCYSYGKSGGVTTFSEAPLT